MRLIACETLELLRDRVESDHRIRGPIAQPDLVIRIDPHRVGLRLVTRKLPFLPGFGDRIVKADLSGIPFTDPEPSFRVGPDAARALVLGRRLVDGRGAAFEIDVGEITV